MGLRIKELGIPRKPGEDKGYVNSSENKERQKETCLLGIRMVHLNRHLGKERVKNERGRLKKKERGESDSEMDATDVGLGVVAFGKLMRNNKSKFPIYRN